MRSITGSEIGLFGYEIFAPPTDPFLPPQSTAVGPDHPLVPGDELRITLWGQKNADFPLVIDREGNVSVPEIGVVRVAGLTFDEARTLLREEFARYYKLSEVKINVSMGRLSTITVFVVGKARRPGSYSIPSISTILNALLAAGGPSKAGTLRDIQVKRAGKTVARLDLYDLLLRGDKTSDVRIENGDVIFIPPAGARAAVFGHVNTPAVYELRGESTAADLLGLAGGLDEVAFKGRLRIDRIYESNRTTVLEENLGESDLAGIEVRPGDLVSVFSVVRDEEVVRLSGAVQREGEYGAAEALTVKDLVELAGGLKYYAYTAEAELTRVHVTQDGPETEKITVNLARALEGDLEHNISLKANDYLFIRPVPEWDLYRVVTVKGEVRFPGTYTVSRDERISSLIERAGGFTGKAYLNGAVFTRESVRQLQQIQLDEAVARLERELLASSVVSAETALTPEEVASQQAANVQRQALLKKIKAATARGRVTIDLAPLDEFRGTPSDLLLEEGDVIVIPETPSEVHVIGAVFNQTAFVYDEDASVSDYLALAGGVTRSADKGEIYVLKVDGTAISRKTADSHWPVRWDRRNNRWVGGDLYGQPLDPGDTIVIPEKVERVAWLREVKDITQILYQIAVTAGVLIVAF